MSGNKYALAISDIIDIPVSIEVRDGDKTVTHKFSVQAPRIPQAELQAIQQDGDKTIEAVLTEKVIGWKGQRLVLEADKTPAAFSAEAFAVLLSIAGVGFNVWSAYLATNAVGATPEGRKKL